MFNNILVLCTGNICRSPIAEALLKAALPARQVHSAGIGAMVGWPADPHSVSLCTEAGVTLDAHRARQLTGEMMQAADLVLVMDQGHVDELTRRYPQHRGKVQKWLRWQGNVDVDDPYGMPRREFERIYAEIESGTSDWVKRL